MVRNVAIVVLLLATAIGADTSKSDIIHHHSIEPPFIHDWWQEGLPHWDIGGDAVVTEKFIRLAPAFASRWGWLWNSQPNDNPWWELRATFRVGSKQGIGADGIAFWYVEEPYKKDEPGPLLGMGRVFKGIGILFDSYDNDNRRDNPATSLITNIHGETNQWDTDSDLLHQARARCVFDHRNTAPNDPVEMIVTYVHNKLSIRLRSQMRNVDVSCADVDGIELPQNWYFGVTATTGHLVDNHDLLGISLRALGEPIGDPQQPLEHFDHEAERREKSQWARNDN